MQIDSKGFTDAGNPFDGVPEFYEAGTGASGSYVCADCGYGISVRAALPVCPMCRGSAWEQAPGTLFR